MEQKIKPLERLIENVDKTQIPEISKVFHSILNQISTKIDKYIGDYPTFIEPVFLGENVKIGDDVLLGPNVYIGSNSIIEDFVEISNSLLLENVKIGENIKLENCIVSKNSDLNFSKFIVKNSLIYGSGTSKENLTIYKL